jgi:pSer/pThr/pTyr-binding forkhead associated (FHA) protein
LPAPLLTFLKYIFLALLYLFFLRVLRAVWIELREPKVVGPEAHDVVFADSFAVAASAPGARAPSGSGATTTVIPLAAAPHFVVTSPPGRSGATYPVGAEATVGRSPGCSISLPDDTFVSQVHARVFQRDGQWWVEDLGSTNGTYLGAERVRAPQIIRAGDRVQFGQTVMELRP